MKKHKEIKPPHLADKFFAWYCKNLSVEDLHGDLLELFDNDTQRMSAQRAKLKYWQRILSLTFSYAIKKRKQKASYHHYASTSFNPAMLKNYFLIATRSLAKHKLFTIINVFGLAVGMSISLLVIAMLSFLYRYDTFHVHKNRIYRVTTQTYDKQHNPEFASAPAELADKLKHGFSGIEEVVRISSALRVESIYEGKKIPMHGYFTDPEFLKVFTFPLVKGNISTVLEKPHQIVITEKAAVKMFGDADPVGKVMQMGEFGEFEITGVLKDLPRNSHMQFDVLASYQSIAGYKQNGPLDIDPWMEFRNSYVYLLLPEQHEIRKIENFLNKVSEDVYRKKENFKAEFRLQSLASIAPGRDLFNQIGPEWGYTSISILIFFTLLILLPACFNYANISISRALKRMKEIGLRKVMGGQQGQIFFQFIMETVIITLIALLFSYYIFTLIRPEFISMIVGAEALELTMDPATILYFILFALFVGFVSGTVPALYFSKLSPIQALKGKPTPKKTSGFTLRKTLIVSQFTLSLSFIMGVVIMMSQYRYTINYDFGFQQENILDVKLQGTDPQILKNEFSKISAVQTISMSSHIMGTGSTDREWIKNIGATDSAEAFEMFIDANYLSNLNLKLIAGNNFSSGGDSNKKYIIVNEEFLKALRFKDAADAIGQPVILWNGEEVIIKGVVKSFHYLDLREPIRSFFFRYDPGHFQYANVKIISKDIYSDISEIESAWKSFGGENKFQAAFFDDEIKDAYAFYFTMIKVCGFLGLLAITISCLGLLGMVVFTVENRVKEVGIRKAMGATSGGLTFLLSKDFLRLMVIAAFIAIPLTYFFFDKLYLTMQYYRGAIGIGEIIVSLAIMLLLGLSTILSQTLRAARANPVDILRYE